MINFDTESEKEKIKSVAFFCKWLNDFGNGEAKFQKSSSDFSILIETISDNKPQFWIRFDFSSKIVSTKIWKDGAN